MIKDLFGQYEGESMKDSHEEISVFFVLEKNYTDQIVYRLNLSHSTEKGYYSLFFEGVKYAIADDELVLMPQRAQEDSWDQESAPKEGGLDRNTVFHMQIKPNHNDSPDLLFREYRLSKSSSKS